MGSFCFKAKNKKEDDDIITDHKKGGAVKHRNAAQNRVTKEE